MRRELAKFTTDDIDYAAGDHVVVDWVVDADGTTRRVRTTLIKGPADSQKRAVPNNHAP